MPHNINDIAIVGMAARLPEARDINQFWHNLCAGKESISFFSEQELLSEGISAEDIHNSNYIKAKGYLEDAGLFAAKFFGYNPAEAKLLDPQHRIILEIAWEALECAGCVPEDYEGEIGVFVSSSFGTYLLSSLLSNPSLNNLQNHYQFVMANANDFLATRIAYKLNLTGPAQTIQTACSSSLAAIHHACQSLLHYECDAALAGGVCITTPSKSGYLYKREGITSHDGHCRPFDKEANGTVPANGAGVVVLKRLEDALKENDHIFSVIKGSAINNDGSCKIGYTAPSVQGQSRVINMAHAIAGISADTIQYVESHGTGTALGDPIELEGLRNAFKSTPNHCAIGSLKANIGHLDAAAGVAGIIKTALMLHHKSLPPQINYAIPNPRLGIESSPFYINTALKEWPRGESPRRAGVSAFGIGGTNVHLVLEESPLTVSSGYESCWHILPLSADSTVALQMLTDRLVSYLNSISDVSLANVAYTLQKRRKVYGHRGGLVARHTNTGFEYRPLAHEQRGKLEFLSDDTKYQILQWLSGQHASWDSVNFTKAKVTPLPPYPFYREYFWHDPIIPAITKLSATSKPPTANTDTESLIIKIIQGLTGEQKVVPGESFHCNGIDSFAEIDLLLHIEEKFGILISIQDYKKIHSVNELISYINNRISISANVTKQNSLVSEIKNGTGPTLFCIHPAGGSISVFEDLAHYIGSEIRIVGIRAYGWIPNENPDHDIVIMAARYISAIKEAQPEGPYRLCGSSMGGLIALEIAQQFQQQNEVIALLSMLDTPSPEIFRNLSNTPSDASEVEAYIKSLSPEMASTLERSDTRSLSMERFYQLWLNHCNAIKNYTSPAYEGPVTYFSASEQNKYFPHALELSWKQLIKGSLEIYKIPGNHITIHQSPNVRFIAEILHEKISSTSSYTNDEHSININKSDA